MDKDNNELAKVDVMFTGEMANGDSPEVRIARALKVIEHSFRNHNDMYYNAHSMDAVVRCLCGSIPVTKVTRDTLHQVLPDNAEYTEYLQTFESDGTPYPLREWSFQTVHTVGGTS